MDEIGVPKVVHSITEVVGKEVAEVVWGCSTSSKTHEIIYWQSSGMCRIGTRRRRGEW